MNPSCCDSRCSYGEGKGYGCTEASQSHLCEVIQGIDPVLFKIRVSFPLSSFIGSLFFPTKIYVIFKSVQLKLLFVL